MRSRRLFGASTFGLDGDVVLQGFGDLVQDGAHVQVQGRALVMGQQLSGEAEAERLLSGDPYRR